MEWATKLFKFDEYLCQNSHDMDIQLLVVLILFAIALFLIGRRIYRQFEGKKQAGCEKCGVSEIDSTKISGK